MHSFLPLVQLAILLSTTFIVAAAAPNDDPNQPLQPQLLQCKCQPHDPCWPTPSTWSSFNATVHGRLIATTPVAQPCYPSSPSYNPATCATVQKGYYYEDWRQQQPGAFQYTNWEVGQDGQGCLLSQSLTGTCAQGAVPVYSVKAATVEDVQATVRFASTHNLKLVVKNTGHDLLGRSTAAGSLNLWVFFMKKIQVVDAFVPEGAPSGTQGVGGVILEAGVVWKDAYKVVDEHNRTVSGGGSPTVGTSGAFCQSGGHGPLSPSVGLCVDNVLQYKVVTADGELRVVNAYQHADLFWAMRGGGPGFGVVVEAVYKTHPAVKMGYFQVTISSEDRSVIANVTREYYARHVAWSDAQWAGYGTLSQKYMVVTYMQPNGNAENALKTFGPFMDYVRGLGNVQVDNEAYTMFPSFNAYFENMTAQLPAINAGFGCILASRLIPRTLVETEQGVNQLSETMLQIHNDVATFAEQYTVALVAGGEVARGSLTETSLHPAWRKALMQILIFGGWEENMPWQDQQKVRQSMAQASDGLRTITPGSATYLNEANPDEPDFQQNFFGSIYVRLKSIKDKYDPKGLFVCHLCVGSDDWDSDQLCPSRL
ncbi:hypothetical protein BGZ73_007349 [Actinomortierella ambigua]|nr:hypothetical protein BGZ73_007349 [Actinomortierella ambigua]